MLKLVLSSLVCFQPGFQAVVKAPLSPICVHPKKKKNGPQITPLKYIVKGYKIG
jgi:hypothetical protein